MGELLILDDLALTSDISNAVFSARDINQKYLFKFRQESINIPKEENRAWIISIEGLLNSFSIFLKVLTRVQISYQVLIDY